MKSIQFLFNFTGQWIESGKIVNGSTKHFNPNTIFIVGGKYFYHITPNPKITALQNQVIA